MLAASSGDLASVAALVWEVPSLAVLVDETMNGWIFSDVEEKQVGAVMFTVVFFSGWRLMELALFFPC